RCRCWPPSSPPTPRRGSPSSQSSPRSAGGGTADVMYHWIPFWPDTAAVNADAVDALYVAELALSALIMATVLAMMLRFCARYRRGSAASRAGRVDKTWGFEVAWTTATLAAFLVLFVWGAVVYIWLFQSPPADEEVYVVGKQWMWKVEHPGGQRE